MQTLLDRLGPIICCTSGLWRMQFRVREDITALGYDYFPFMLVVLKIKLIGTNGGREC